jgi:hypothetical protein
MSGNGQSLLPSLSSFSSLNEQVFEDLPSLRIGEASEDEDDYEADEG